MASMASVISIIVLLLAAYCHSAPVKTAFQFSTAENELTSIKPETIEIDVEFVTIQSKHAKRLEGGSGELFTTERSIPEGHNSNKRTMLKESPEVSSVIVPIVHKRSHDVLSEEFTTERSFPKQHIHNKREGDENKRSVENENDNEENKRSVENENENEENKRSVENENEENKRSVENENENEENKRSVENENENEENKRSVENENENEENKRSVENENENEENKRSVENENENEENKRSVENENENEENKRSVENENENEENKRSVENENEENKRSVENENEENKRSVENENENEENKRSVDVWTTVKTEMVDGKGKRTDEHTFSNEFFTTVESSTEFNNRAVRMMGNEKVGLELTTVPESSSFETLAHTTGLLKQRNVVVPHPKNSEESDEKEFTTAKSHN